jgi:short-subunit dehydrogenase
MENRSQGTALLAAAGIGALLGAYALTRRRREYSFTGRTVVITGGSRGLGLVLAREFAAEGARLVLAARDPEDLERAAEELRTRGTGVHTVSADVTEADQAEGVIREAEAQFGTVDVLVNNAGIISVGPMEVMTLKDYADALRLHFWAPLYTTLAALPGMRRRKHGRIVNIASIGGKIAVPHLLPYCASKFALVGLSEGLRADLAKDGVAVTTVCPGLMRTGSPVNANFKGQHRAEYAWFTLADSLPGASISADSAARSIVAACRRGDAEIVLSLPAQVAVLFHGVFPGLTADVLGMVNRLLPEPGGIGTDIAKGHESESPVTRSWLTSLTRQAVEANNQAA